MESILLPVWGASRFASAAQDLGFNPTDWTDHPPLAYPHGLISYVHWQQPFEFPDNAYIFGDSGGFSLRASATRARHLDAETILRWQAQLCTVGCLLDVPPLNGHWRRTLDGTLHHTRQALPYYRALRDGGHRFRWWGVLHGNNEREVRDYYGAVSTVYPYSEEGEGWAIRAEPSVNIYTVARSLRILRALGITRAHFFAATAQEVIAVLLALGPRAGLTLISFDSAYATKTGFNRHVFKPRENGVTFGAVREKGEQRQARDYLATECLCCVCEHMRERSAAVPKARYELERGTFGGWWSTWAQVHNLRIQHELTSAQAREAAADPDRLLRSMLKEKEYSLVMRIVEEDGHEPATR